MSTQRSARALRAMLRDVAARIELEMTAREIHHKVKGTPHAGSVPAIRRVIAADHYKFLRGLPDEERDRRAAKWLRGAARGLLLALR